VDAAGILRAGMISTVAVGTDGSATAAEAVKVATEVARRFDAELVLVSAFQESGREPLDRASASEEVQWAFSPSARVRETLTRTEERVRREGIACRALVDEGDPADVLVRLAAECEADVLVIGNKGMGRRLLGSVPNSVTHKAGCSVLVVKTT
jgi:nucleotide-binding universal stress UspA family protein